jgi:hypothetical protein
MVPCSIHRRKALVAAPFGAGLTPSCGTPPLDRHRSPTPSFADDEADEDGAEAADADTDDDGTGSLMVDSGTVLVDSAAVELGTVVAGGKVVSCGKVAPTVVVTAPDGVTVVTLTFCGAVVVVSGASTDEGTSRPGVVELV